MSSGDLIGDTRLLLGLLIAPALIPIYRAIVPYYDFYSVRGEALIEPVAIAAGVAYVGAAILGLPYTFSLRGIGWLNYGTVMAPTLILVALVLLLEQMTPHGIGNVYGGVMSIAPGVLWAGICFHLLTIWRYEPGAKWPLLLSIAFIW
ncbi:MAG: hypothetical protein FJ280_14990, partial [Planctomycetes bacterium]|nr:hypothetical protein [Planctomycetota bacterium]